ncbi:MAG: endopeptidase La [Gemmataceae bacterium]|nr:endopeptidase La [Gemmataceae bacterium]
MSEPTPIPSNVSLPVLPLKNTVLFPTLFLPLGVGRDNSVAAVEAAVATEEKIILVVAQRNADDDRLDADALFSVGTRAVIKKMNRSDDAVEVMVQGIERVRIVRIDQVEPHLRAVVDSFPLPTDESPEIEALQREVLDAAARVVELAQPPQGPAAIMQMLSGTADPLRLTFLLGSMLSLDVAKEQALLEAPTRLAALQRIHEYLTHEAQILELKQQIASKAQGEMTREQRQYFLRQQMRAIQDELGERSPEGAEADVLREKLAAADLPEAVRVESDRELTRLERLPSQAPDYQVTRTWLELIAELPWKNSSDDVLDIERTQTILDEDHYGLTDVKERILEHLAVLKLNPKAKAPILCFVGPPGVGKTSLGHSIARSMSRKFERLSLGGMHDESELRGHRRTYIGAMPGRIIQAVRRAGVNNPMILLDEVDKLGRDFRGDPSAALLEVLDPAQNSTFRDNYLDLPFDLSKVFFVATANALDPLPRPLLDRLEIIRLSGYSEDEKLQIAKRYLIPRQRAESGLTVEQSDIPEKTIVALIRGYTREAGCRQLERTIGQVMRKLALRVARGSESRIAVSEELLVDLLGPEHFVPEDARREMPPGVATGMAWTEAGGEVLYIEAMQVPGSGELRITGQLGNIMQESARAAQSYVASHAGQLGIDRDKFKEGGVHIHVPAGAVPKDGPSAGVALVTALASLFTGRPARADTAMTGEITLTGLVLPIGGVKEKILGARRAGIKRIILPKANAKDIRDLPASVREDTKVIFAEKINDVLAAALEDGRA